MSQARSLEVVRVPDVTGPKLSVRGVAKSYRNARGTVISACADVTFDVAPGEFVCLLGPSGCGKSTCLGLIAGLDRPDQGEIFMDGRPITGSGPDRAMLFQEPALFPWVTVLGSLEFALRLVGSPRPGPGDPA